MRFGLRIAIPLIVVTVGFLLLKFQVASAPQRCTTVFVEAFLLSVDSQKQEMELSRPSILSLSTRQRFQELAYYREKVTSTGYSFSATMPFSTGHPIYEPAVFLHDLRKRIDHNAGIRIRLSSAIRLRYDNAVATFANLPLHHLTTVRGEVLPSGEIWASEVRVKRATHLRKELQEQERELLGKKPQT